MGRKKVILGIVRTVAVVCAATLLFILAVNLLVWNSAKDRIVDVDNAI